MGHPARECCVRWFDNKALYTLRSTVRLNVSHSELSVLLLVASLACIAASAYIHTAIIAAINRRRDADSQVSNFDRDFLGIFDLHRQLYPTSNLRKAFILSFAFSMICGLGFIFLQNSHQ
jgi:hypothetical protein